MASKNKSRRISTMPVDRDDQGGQVPKPQHKGDFGDQLAKVTGRPREAARFATPPSSTTRSPSGSAYVYASNLPPCARYGQEGTDHVNMDRVSKTELGQNLHMGAHLRFNHDLIGKVDSISRLWTSIDQIVGSNAINVKGVQLIVLLADAVWQKVQQYPLLANALKDNQLPLDSYYFSEAGIPIRNKVSYWWIEIMNKIREALLEGKDYPDFDNLYVGEVKPVDQVKIDFMANYIPNHRSNQSHNQPLIDTSLLADSGPTLTQQLREALPIRMGRGGRRSFSALPVERKSDAPTAETPKADTVIDQIKADPSLGTVSESGSISLAPGVKIHGDKVVKGEVFIPQMSVGEPMLEDSVDSSGIEDPTQFLEYKGQDGSAQPESFEASTAENDIAAKVTRADAVLNASSTQTAPELDLSKGLPEHDLGRGQDAPQQVMPANETPVDFAAAVGADVARYGILGQPAETLVDSPADATIDLGDAQHQSFQWKQNMEDFREGKMPAPVVAEGAGDTRYELSGGVVYPEIADGGVVEGTNAVLAEVEEGRGNTGTIVHHDQQGYIEQPEAAIVQDDVASVMGALVRDGAETIHYKEGLTEETVQDLELLVKDVKTVEEGEAVANQISNLVSSDDKIISRVDDGEDFLVNVRPPYGDVYYFICVKEGRIMTRVLEEIMPAE